ALKANAIISASLAPYNGKGPEVEKVAAAYDKQYPKEVPKASVPFGYSQGKVMYEALQKACDQKDLTRAGLVKAARSLSNVDMGGLTTAPLDSTKVGKPSTRTVFISQ